MGKIGSLNSLKCATRTLCLKRVEKWAPGWWNERDEQWLKASVRVQEDLRLLMQLRDALEAYLAHVETAPESTHRPIPEKARELLRWMPVGKPDRRVKRTPRINVVVCFDRHGMFWWYERQPTNTELAVLSILAGNFSERLAGVSEQVTAMDVLRAEAKAIGEIRVKLGTRKRTKQNGP